MWLYIDSERKTLRTSILPDVQITEEYSIGTGDVKLRPIQIEIPIKMNEWFHLGIDKNKVYINGELICTGK